LKRKNTLKNISSDYTPDFGKLSVSSFNFDFSSLILLKDVKIKVKVSIILNLFEGLLHSKFTKFAGNLLKDSKLKIYSRSFSIVSSSALNNFDLVYKS